MRYFTPELFERLQDLHDPSARQEWDRAAERYASALQLVMPQFPDSLRKIAGEAILHDAEVLSISQSKQNLCITLQPELDEDHLLVLDYTLVYDPRISTGVFSVQHRTDYSAWLYDEFSVGDSNVGGSDTPRWPAPRRLGTVPVFRHDILLSNGVELLLRFRQFKFARRRKLLPAPRTPDPAGTLSRSA